MVVESGRAGLSVTNYWEVLAQLSLGCAKTYIHRFIHSDLFFFRHNLSRPKQIGAGSTGAGEMVVSSAPAVCLQARGRYLPLMLANERPKWSYYCSSHSAPYTSGRNTAKWRPWLFWEQQGSLLNVPHPSLQHESCFFFFFPSAGLPVSSVSAVPCCPFDLRIAKSTN